MALNMNSKPLLIAGLGIAAVYLLNRRRVAVVNTSAASRTGQDYHTPTAVAQLLGNALAIFTKGAKPAAPVGANATPAAPALTLATLGKGAFGWNTSDNATTAGSLTSPVTGWYMPAPSSVGLPSVSSIAVDSAINAPVYDLGEDFTNNPFAALGL